jgi:hypothetical protein
MVRNANCHVRVDWRRERKRTQHVIPHHETPTQARSGCETSRKRNLLVKWYLITRNDKIAKKSMRTGERECREHRRCCKGRLCCHRFQDCCMQHLRRAKVMKSQHGQEQRRPKEQRRERRGRRNAAFSGWFGLVLMGCAER